MAMGTVLAHGNYDPPLMFCFSLQWSRS